MLINMSSVGPTCNCLAQLRHIKKYYFLIRSPMNYRDFSVKINGENNSEIAIFIFTVCKKRSFYEFSAKGLAQKL